MKRFEWRTLMGIVCLLCGASASAAAESALASRAEVEGVRMPVWVVRDGVRKPLLPGQSLQYRDKVLTGAQARVSIRLADGSTVKLGENAELRLNALDRREDRVFTGALEVIRGAFRLTSGSVPYQRALNLRVRTITAGVRNADLWGRADERGDLLCVLDGEVMTLHARDEARFFSEPSSCYFAVAGAALPRPLDDFGPDLVRQGVAQTDFPAGSETVRSVADGLARVTTVESEAEALELYDRARAAGRTVRIKPRRVGQGVYHYTVRIAGLPSRGEARSPRSA